MNETKNKNNNKSLFLYTGLIFVVAVLLIIISFFGQTHLKNSQPKIETNEEEQQTGIAERASVLSEENKTLIEENSRLREENETLIEKQTENDLLLAANGYFSLGNNDKALELILAVDYEKLSSDQKIIYDTIKAGIDAAE